MFTYTESCLSHPLMHLCVHHPLPFLLLFLFKPLTRIHKHSPLQAYRYFALLILRTADLWVGIKTHISFLMAFVKYCVWRKWKKEWYPLCHNIIIVKTLHWLSTSHVLVVFCPFPTHMIFLSPSLSLMHMQIIHPHSPSIHIHNLLSPKKKTMCIL